MSVDNLNPQKHTDGVPIAIGITGHRNIHSDAYARVRQQLANVFSDIKSSYPNSSLILLTPLAEGADQLAAELALELGINIYAVLPMPLVEYRRDFSVPESLDKFDGFIQRARYRRSFNEFDPQTQRSLCYAAVGKWLVDNSDVLIALWDGEMNGLAGGTGEVVNYALDGTFPSLKLYVDRGKSYRNKQAIIHINTPRKNTVSSVVTEERAVFLKASTNNTGIKKFPYEGLVSGLDLLANIDEYNQTTAPITEPGYPLTNYAETELPAHLEFLHKLYRKSDSVANRYQISFQRYTKVFYSLTATLLLILLLYFRVLPFTYVIGFYLIVYVLTLGVSIRLKNTDTQKKYQLYRLLGEASRLFFFFELSEEKTGQRPSVLNSSRESHYFLRKLGEPNHWVMNLFRKKELFHSLDEPQRVDASVFDAEAIDVLKKHWIQDQQVYFSRASIRDKKKLRALDRSGMLLFLLSFVSGIALLTIKYLDWTYSDSLIAVLGMAIAASAGLGGIIKTYAFTMGYSELSGRYAMMEELFATADQAIGTDPDESIAVIDQLWWEAFMENIEWFSLKSARMVKTFDIKKVLNELLRWTKI